MSSHLNTEKIKISLLLSCCGRILWRGYSSPIGKWGESTRLTPSFSPGGCWARWQNSMLYYNLKDCRSCKWYKLVLSFFPRLWQPPASVPRAANLSWVWSPASRMLLQEDCLAASISASLVQETFRCQNCSLGSGRLIQFGFLEGCVFIFSFHLLCHSLQVDQPDVNWNKYWLEIVGPLKKPCECCNWHKNII